MMPSYEFSTTRDTKAPVQSIIETAMKDFCNEQRWESIFLYSSEGLLMANAGTSMAYKEENLLEFAFSLMDTVCLLSRDLPIKEIVIRGKEKRLLVFRYFESWGSIHYLTAVIAGRKGYKRAMNKLVKIIRNLNDS